MKVRRSQATVVGAAVALACGAGVTCGPPEDSTAAPHDGKSASFPIPVGDPVIDDGPAIHRSGDVSDAGVCWKDLAPLNFERAQAAATVLKTGAVLVVGGLSPTGPLASVEFYDPETGRWSLRTRMPTARRALASTLLDSGLVLVTGGAAEKDVGPNTPADIVSLNTVEIYDPDTDTWATKAPMHGRRWLHAAHRLDDGRILVAGGVVEREQVAAEVYDPVADTWTPIPFLDGGGGPRFVVLVSTDDPGRVMVVTRGASYVIDVDAGKWHFLAPRGGRGGESVFAARVGHSIWTFAAMDGKWAERFDSDAGEWERVDAGFVLGRDLATALVLEDGRRYMMTGGYLSDLDWRFAKTAIADVFDADRGVFIPAGRLKIPRIFHAMVELRPGIPMVIGGGASDARVGSSGSTSVEVFDPNCAQLGDPQAQ